MNIEPMSPALSILAAADYAGCSRDTILYWIAEHGLPVEEWPTRGKRTCKRVRAKDLDVFLAKHRKVVEKAEVVVVPRPKTRRGGRRIMDIELLRRMG